MQFDQPLTEGILIRRYKRFLADVELGNGRVITVHTPNTGSMLGCCTPGSRVWLSDSANPKRKYRLTWELVESRPGVLVGINTSLANRLAEEAIEAGVIGELQGYRNIRREVRYGRENSRIDLLLEDGPASDCYVEVKNVTLADDGVARFPDAVSQRGTRHLRELEHMVRRGRRGVIVFCIQRADAAEFRPADDIDPEYSGTLRQVMANGVEALAYRADVGERAVRLERPLPVVTG